MEQADRDDRSQPIATRKDASSRLVPTLQSYEPTTSKHFANLCLVCKDWLPVAQKYLYAYLDLFNEKHPDLLLRTLTDNKKLRPFIVSVRCGMPKRKKAPTKAEWVEHVAIVMHGAKTLKVLRVHGIAYPGLRHLIPNLVRLQQLAYLEISVKRDRKADENAVNGLENLHNLFEARNLKTLLLDTGLVRTSGPLDGRFLAAAHLREIISNMELTNHHIMLFSASAPRLESFCVDAPRCSIDRQQLFKAVKLWQNTLQVLRISSRTFDYHCHHQPVDAFKRYEFDFGELLTFNCPRLHTLQLSTVHLDYNDFSAIFTNPKHPLQVVDFAMSQFDFNKLCKNVAEIQVSHLKIRLHYIAKSTGLVTPVDLGDLDQTCLESFWQKVEERGIVRMKEYWWTSRPAEKLLEEPAVEQSESESESESEEGEAVAPTVVPAPILKPKINMRKRKKLVSRNCLISVPANGDLV